MIQLGFQGTSWYQNLLVQPDQPVGFCKPLLHQILGEIEGVWRSPWPEGPPGALLVLVGLMAAEADYTFVTRLLFFR